MPDSLQPVAHALIQARDEARALLRTFPRLAVDTPRRSRVRRVPHLKHLAGVVDRLFTYARGEALSGNQRDALARERSPWAVWTISSRTLMHRSIAR